MEFQTYCRWDAAADGLDELRTRRLRVRSTDLATARVSRSSRRHGASEISIARFAQRSTRFHRVSRVSSRPPDDTSETASLSNHYKRSAGADGRGAVERGRDARRGPKERRPLGERRRRQVRVLEVTSRRVVVDPEPSPKHLQPQSRRSRRETCAFRHRTARARLSKDTRCFFFFIS